MLKWKILKLIVKMENFEGLHSLTLLGTFRGVPPPSHLSSFLTPSLCYGGWQHNQHNRIPTSQPPPPSRKRPLVMALHFCLVFRSSHQRCSVKKVVLRNFTKFTGKHLCQVFVKFLRTPFLQNTSGRILLSY